MEEFIQGDLFQLFLFIVAILQLWSLINIFKLMGVFDRCDGTVKSRMFFTKCAFSFDSGDKKIALCKYYQDDKLQEEAKEAGVEFCEYLRALAPHFDFKTEMISNADLNKLGLPGKITVKRKSIETNAKIVVTHADSKCIFVLYKPLGFEPYKTFWIGSCVQTETYGEYLQIYRGLQKAIKRKLKC